MKLLSPIFFRFKISNVLSWWHIWLVITKRNAKKTTNFLANFNLLFSPKYVSLVWFGLVFQKMLFISLFSFEPFSSNRTHFFPVVSNDYFVHFFWHHNHNNIEINIIIICITVFCFNFSTLLSLFFRFCFFQVNYSIFRRWLWLWSLSYIVIVV